MNRIIAMLGALALALSSLAGTALAEDAPKNFGGVTLRVATFPATWIERIRSEVGTQLEAAGIKLEFVPGTSAEFLAKLVAARGQPAPFDVVEIADETYPDFRAGDFLKKLDLSQIPNTALLDPSLFDEYHVGNWLSEPCIVYNVDKFVAAGVPAPKRFSDLADPRLAGRVLVADISVYIAYYEITALAYENGGSEADPTPGFAALKRIAPQSATNSAATAAQLFGSGEVWAAIWPAHLAQRLAHDGLNVSTVHPVIKGKHVAIARGYVGIVSDSQLQDAGEYYVNAILAQHVQQRFHTESGLTPVNRDVQRTAAAAAAKDRTGAPFSLLAPEDIADAWWPDYKLINKRDWAKQFQRALAN
jgi:putative spermidine/putrescine transport system substrate-binding protein